MKKIIVSLFMLAFLSLGQGAFATSIWNTGSQGPECPDINIANATTTTGYGSPCWTLTNVNASPGNTIAVKIYYHNTSGGTATSTHIKVVAPSGSSTTQSFTGQILSPQGNLYTSAVTASLSSAQTVTFQSTVWYTRDANGNLQPTPLLNGQNGSEAIGPNGLNIGNIPPGWPAQGAVVVNFLVSSTPPPQNCTISNFNANPNQIIQGASSTLSWNTNNCTSANISPNVGTVPVNGNQSVSPTQTTTYTLTAYGSNGGQQTRTVTVTVVPPPQNCTISSFTANPPQINQGGSSTLTWSTSNCTSASISPNVGTVPVNGNQTVYPTQTTTYTLTAYGSNGGQQTRTVTVTVVIPQNCTINGFTANPTSITSGGSSTLTWSTSNCTSVTISNLNYNIPLSGSQVVYPTQTTTYVLTATGSNGGQQTRTVTVTVVPPPQNCTISSFTANPPQINQGGSSTLTWSTTNCTSVTISNLNYNVPLSGSQAVYPTYTTTYVLTAVGSNGSSISKSQTVTVNHQLTCTINSFTANPNSINQGGSSTLTWNTTNCTSVTISNLNYNVPLSGSQAVYPTQTTTYTLTATGSNGSSISKSQTVTVNHQLTCTINSFTTNPTSITSGGSSTLTWSTSNCTSVTISNLNYNVPLSGSQVVYPTQTTTYVLTAVGSNGSSISQSQTVTINSIQNCSISNFTANGSSSITIQSGNAVNLVWNTTGNCTVTITGPNFNSSIPSGSQTIYPTYSGTYTLSAYGSNSGTQTQSVYVDVNQGQNNNCTISYFNASPTSINYGGLSTLSWSTSNCTSVSITNLGSVNNYGSQTVYPTNSTNYTINAYSSNGIPVTQTIQVSVNNYVPPPTPVYNACAITTVATNVTRNSVTLNGLITNSNSYNTNTYFEYGTTINLGSQTNPRLVNGNTTFNETLTGLSPNTIYFYRLVSSCDNGNLSRGAIEIFQTSGIPTNTNTNTTTIIRQGTTVIGTASPIMLKIEDRYQSIKVGDSIDYTVTYKNISSRILTHPILQVILPKGVTFLNSSRGTYSSDTYTLTVPLEDLVPNVEGVVYLQGRVDSIDTGNAQIVTTALLIYTATNGAQENAMAYVLNNPMGNNSLTAAAFFSGFWGFGLLGWLLLLILILLAILLFRRVYRRPPVI